ncbi:VanZ family protein [Aromatoleum toluolicum]|uniref:DUF4962 domain-containing protein n=1 Tax=Aromatoleum toluolicum TaxID=90060 RepID=A0ABX1NBP5_9RHOO|nr:VanZ family protein [Aromatoleum toluolicum]NMF96723.1 VanZ family protein [Aromatoleum toluolicum]
MPASAPVVARNPYAAATLAWAVFIVYGSLVPLDFRPRPDAWQAFLATPYLALGVGSRADWVANILLYLVLAYCATGAIQGDQRSPRIFRLAGTLGACLALALGIEFLQLYFPPRTVSLNDLIAEFLGTGLGCALWFASGRRFAAMWARFVGGGAHSVRALLALYASGYLAFSLFPYDFLVSATELTAKLTNAEAIAFAPTASCGAGLSCATKLFAEAVLVMPFGALLVVGAGTQQARRAGAFAGLALGMCLGLAIELVQILLASGTTQGISVLTRGLGAAWGAALARSAVEGGLRIEPGAARRAVLLATPLYLLLTLALNEVLPLRLQPLWAATEKLAELRFLPFYYHYYTSETAAVRSVLAIAGSYAPIGLAAALAFPGRRRAAWAAILLGAALCLGIEVLKLFTAAKHPDPTNLLIAGASVWLTDALASRALRRTQETSPTTVQSSPRRPAPLWRLPLGVALPVAALGAVVAATRPPASWSPADNGAHTTFPPPEAAPAVSLPGFRDAHPRLPHPSAADLAQLAARNPGYLAARRNAAGGGKGPVDAVAFTALAAPGSQDLGLLHRRLMEMRFTDRGDDQVKALALAYDWLHAQWSYAERIALHDKLGEGCQYVIDFIRRERLSPYNAILYNSPLQALMACSIALYREHPRGDALMAFTHDLWTRRVLPVWRQVFGTHGGWHEGGEYVAVGIGQAVYTVPAMWLAATGENLFESEVGLRGFLDFLVYRTRPDGTQIRWGDASNLQRHPPDAAPLALHYRHAAAYGLAAAPAAPTPTGWPWGPLSEATLTDPGSVATRPLSRHFDGIGLVVARNDWTPDATYVTFKAGDNFWSHSHLDQGAFTIDKGGPLAVDSGIYGPRYGSDHHMNYAYQTVAHNALTVTDPADDAPLPTPEGPRPIANDGGQRRVGSGWHVAPAPIDRDEWERARELYHTGRIARLLDEDALTVAVADLTPAYTNAHSARGEASHRSRRVERAWRVFGYDRIDDVVVIYDDVRATDPAFRKRWLLHANSAPEVSNEGFVVAAPPRGAARSGGRLEARVLLPQERRLLTTGGRGFEFFVDGRNHDDDGKLVEAMRRPPPAPEAGGWRVELMPAHDALEDRFLVVLLPTSADTRPAHRVRLLRQGEELGCEIAGPQRTTRWWFTPGQLGVRIEIGEAPSVKIHGLRSDNVTPASLEHHWTAWLRSALRLDR